MKKLAKILTLVLAVCVIVSAMAVSAYAADVTSPDGATGEIAPNTPTLTKKNVYRLTAQQDETIGEILFKEQTATTTTKGAWWFTGNSILKTAYDDFGYYVLDFDFCATGYVHRETNTYYEDYQPGCVLSYHENYQLSAGFGGYPYIAKFVLGDDGHWSMTCSTGKGASGASYNVALTKGETVSLATRPNVYNHMTVVDDGTNTYFFVNGVFVCSADGETQATSDTSKPLIGFTDALAATNGVYPFSVKVKNLKDHTYYNNYSSGSAYGIDEFIGDGDYKKKNLHECEDTYFHQNYDSNLGTIKSYTPTFGTNGSGASAIDAVSDEEDGGRVYKSKNVVGASGAHWLIGEKVLTEYPDFGYYVLDFDFCATGYVHRETNTYYEDNQPGCVLSYDENLGLTIGSGNYPYLVKFVLDEDNRYYMTRDSGLVTGSTILSPISGGDKVPLATQPNVYNHMTVVDDGTNTYFFVNGEFVCGFVVTQCSDSVTNPPRIGFSARAILATSKFSIKVKNYTANTYYYGYASGSSYGIDDFIKNNQIDSNKELINCVDTYYAQNFGAMFEYKDSAEGNVTITKSFAPDVEIADVKKDIGEDKGWYTEVDCYAFDGQEPTGFTAGETYTLVYGSTETKAAINYKANVTLLDEFIYHIYIEAADRANISELKFYINDEEQTVAVYEEGYYKFTSESKAFSEWDGEFAVKVTFKVGETPVEGTATVTLADYIVNGVDQHKDNSTYRPLLVNFAKFIDECNKFFTKTDESLSWVKDIFDDPVCANDLLDLPDSSEADHTELEGYLLSYYPIDSQDGVTRFGLAIYVPQGSNVEVSAELKGIAYATISEKEGYYTNQPVDLGVKKSSATYIQGETTYDVYLSEAGTFAIYNMLEMITITIKDGEGTKVGKFDLADYVVNNKDDGITNALYRFAEAAKAFKTNNV